MTHSKLLQDGPVRALLSTTCLLLAFAADARAQSAEVTDLPVPGELQNLSIQSESVRSRKPSFDFESVWGGPDYACGITRDGGVDCWGSTGGFPGVKPNFGPHPTPQPVPGVAHAVSIGTGVFGACAVRDDHTGVCWGSIGTNDSPLVDFPLSDLKAIVPNARTVCALLRNGKVFCSPDGDQIDSFTQVKFDGKVKSLDAANGLLFCALIDGGRSDNRVSCFSTVNGLSGSGELGNDGSDQSFAPAEVRELRGARQIAVGDAHACALVGSDVYCWGDDSAGQLGFESPDTLTVFATPLQVKGLGSVQAVSAGLAHSCALAKNGNVFCWGDAYGKVPQKIADLPKANSLTSGADADCSIADGGATYCFGNNDLGQLGSANPFDDNGEADFFPPERVGQ